MLDIGARDGYIARLLPQYFQTVTALDLEEPHFQTERVTTVRGTATALDFPDDSFDTIVCAEVLEHIPSSMLTRACAEIARVARYDVLIGVPFRQDLRVGRTTCASCGRVNPPWGHVNSFDQEKLKDLLQPLRPVQWEHVEQVTSRTNPISAFLMDLAGNPWGTYNQAEACMHCGRAFQPPAPLSKSQKTCAAVAHALNSIQRLFIPSTPAWIHVLFSKRDFAELEPNSGIESVSRERV